MREDFIYRNICFQEEYKKLDKLCKDCFLSTDGVSEYIRQMENMRCDPSFYGAFGDEYKKLKHVRWIRNQLAHEVGAMQSNLCTQADLGFVKRFYPDILACDDPLTRIRKMREEKMKYDAQHRQGYASINTAFVQQQNIVNKKGRSVFGRIAEKFKNLFSR